MNKNQHGKMLLTKVVSDEKFQGNAEVT